MLKKTLEKLKSLLGISLILLILFFWKISVAQTDTTVVTVDTTIVQIQQIQTDLDEIKEMFKEQKKLLFILLLPFIIKRLRGKYSSLS